MDRRRILVVAATLVAVLGAALVLLYVRGADARAQARYETQRVLTAADRIEAGESFTAALQTGRIQYAEVVTADVAPGALDATSAARLAGTEALATIYPGQQVLAAEFGSHGAATSDLPIPAHHIAVSVTLSDNARVAGYIQPGARVAVFLNGTDADGAAFTRLLVPQIQVLGVGSTAAKTGVDGTSSTSGDGTTQAPAETLPNTLITLAATQREAEKLLYAQQNGTLAMALLSGEGAVKSGPRIDSANLFD